MSKEQDETRRSWSLEKMSQEASLEKISRVIGPMV